MSNSPAGRTAKPVGLKDRLKNLLSLSKEVNENEFSKGSRGSILLTDAVLRSIGPESDLLSRLKKLREFRNVVTTKCLEDGAIETLWLHIQDLILLERNDDGLARRETLDFLIELCKGQYSKLNLCRAAFFKVLQNCSKNDDLNLNFAFLRALTNDGESVEDFEEDLGDLINVYVERISLTSSTQIHSRQTTKDFLDILKTLLKLHAVVFSEIHLKCIIQYVCIFACHTNVDDDILMCLNVLDVILCYAYWPKTTVLIVVTTLCKLVNNAKVCQDVWRSVRNLLGSHFGHSSIYTMCGLLQASETYPDHSVLRGAVFFIGMSLWGAQKVENLRHTPCSVLPSLLQSLQCNSPIVTFEVLITCQRLIQKYGRELQIITWDLIMQILERIYDLVTSASSKNFASKDLIKITPIFHEILTSIEKFHEQNLFNGSPEQLYSLVERSSTGRPDLSIFKLLSYRLQSISPTKSQWLSQLKNLADVYYKKDTRTTIRVRMVEILSEFYVEYRHLYGDDYVETVVLPTFVNVDVELDAQTQSTSLRLLLDVCKFSTKNTFHEILELFEKFLIDRLHSSSIDVERTPVENLNNYFMNVESTVIGLIDVVKFKWNLDPAIECLKILKLLFDHLLLQYEKIFNGIVGGQCRSTILKFFLSLRADRTTGRLFYTCGAEPNVSYYIYCDESSNDDATSSTTSSLTAIYSSSNCLKLFSSVVMNDRYWPCVFDLMLSLPNFLLNRTFVLSDKENNLNVLCSNLVHMCNDPIRASKMQTGSDNLTQLELNEFIYPSLCALVPYRIYLMSGLQQKLAMTIQGAIVSQKSVFVIVATTICIFEMPDIMRPMLKDLIRRMNELPSTPTLAIPTLEFLSTLMRIPMLFEDFTSKHYEYVFAIITPYTNPFRFTGLIVAMAYQVIFRFFLRVPLKFRRSVAKNVVKTVGVSMSRPVSGAEIMSNDGGGDELHSNLNALNLLARQVLLIFLSHYSFRNELPCRRRSKVAELLFNKCKSKHWIIGDRIIGISVSDYGVDESGLCFNCRRILDRPTAAEAATSINADPDFANDDTKLRRRYKSAVQRRVTPQAIGRAPLSMDDSCISSSPQSNVVIPSRKTSLGMPPPTYYSQSVRTSTFGPTFENTRPKTIPASCTCWCRGFVEISIRHAFGQSSWIVWNENVSDNWKGVERNEVFYSLTDAKLSSESTNIGDFNELLRKESWTDFLKTSSVGYLLNLESSSAELLSPVTDDGGGDGGDSLPSVSSPSAAADRPPSSIVVLERDENETESNSVPCDDNLMVDETNLNPSRLSTSSANYSSKSEMIQREISFESSSAPTAESSATDDDNSESKYFLLQFFSPYFFRGAADECVYSLPDGDGIARAMKNLDRISSQELQKVGVLYVGPKQTKESEILANQCGSARYDRFLAGLGRLISLKDVDENQTFIGGLSTDGRDGQFTYFWSDQVTQLVFHVATLMPNRDSDKASNEKKRHIGNNHVTIVFNESGLDYKLNTITGQFSYVAIVVEPLDATTMFIKLKAKDEISKWLALKEAVLSDDKVPLLCRQMAMRAELSARIWFAQSSADDVYLSRSLARFKQIRHIKEKFHGKIVSAENAFDAN